MSETQTKKYKYLAKDGSYYDTYEAMRNANVQFNEAHLRSLGLDEFMKKHKKKAKKKSKLSSTTPRKAVRRSKRTKAVRRSKRTRSLTPEFHAGLPADVRQYPKKKHRASPIVRPKLELADGTRSLLKNLPNWLKDMETFLLTVPHGNGHKVVSQENARCVMKQVRCMVSGAGISYHHWAEGVIFKKGVHVDLSMDFDTLHDEATEFEADHGRDLGNGWLMRHAIRKMQCYQQYCVENRNITCTNK